MIGILPLRITTFLTVLGSVGCASRTEHQTVQVRDGKTAKAANRIDALLDELLSGKADGKALKKLSLIFSFPGSVPSVRVFRDKRGNIVRCENVTASAPFTKRNHSAKERIEIHSVDFMNSKGTKPTSR